MDETCSSHHKDYYTSRIAKRKTLLKRPIHKWKDQIEAGVQESTRARGMNHLTQDRLQSGCVLNVLMDNLLPVKEEFVEN
jgi:hypothetical protein